MKIRPVETDLFHVDGQMDTRNGANIRFSQFCKTKITQLQWVVWLITVNKQILIPLAARSKAWVCGRSLFGMVVSIPIGGYVILSLVSVTCCQVEFSVMG